MTVVYNTVVNDSSLREAALKITYTEEVRKELALAIVDVGIRRLEIPIPYRTKFDDTQDLINTIKDHDPDVQVIMHGRAFKGDIEIMGRFDGLDGGAVYIAPTESHRKHKLHGISKEEAKQRLIYSVQGLKDISLKYRRGVIEDASFFAEDKKEDMSYFIDLINSLAEAGATIVSVPDTRGLLSPHQTKERIRLLKKKTNVPLAGHFHNDYGLADINAVTAVLEHIDEIHVSTRGKGAKNGITGTWELIAVLHDLYNISLGVKRGKLRELYEIFTKLTGTKLDSRHPLNANEIGAGTHQCYPKGYIPPLKLKLDFNGHVNLRISPNLSSKTIEKVLANYNLSRMKIRELTINVAESARKKGGSVSPSEIKDIIKREAGVDVPLSRIDELVGFPGAYLLLEVRPNLLENVCKIISGWKGVESVDTTYGTYDAVVQVSSLDVKRRIEKEFGKEDVKIVPLSKD